MKISPLARILIRMLSYGTILGGTTAFLIILLVPLQNPYGSFEPLKKTPIIALGTIIGFIASGTSGSLMMVVASGWTSNKNKNPQVYKHTMMLATFWGTSICLAIPIMICIMFGDNSPNAKIWLTGLGMSPIIAVYISNRVATKYLREVDLRKVKEKVA